jgi:hypothetical protein
MANITRKDLKVEAELRLNILRKNGLSLDYLEDFMKYDKVTHLERGVLFGNIYTIYDNDVSDDKELLNRIKMFENEYNTLVYLVTSSETSIGNLYNFFYVSQHMSEWKDDREILENNETYAYVWNETYELDSEIGLIGFEHIEGRIIRTW